MSEQKKAREFDADDEEFSSTEPTPAAPETSLGRTTSAGVPDSGSEEADDRPIEPDDTVELDNEVVPFQPNPVELRDPDHGNLARQLSRSIHIRVGESEADVERALFGALRLYAGLSPEDAVDSIYARLAVAGTNNAMEAAARAADAAGVDWVNEKYMKIYCQNSDTVVKLLEAMDKHRLRRQQQTDPLPPVPPNAPSAEQAIAGGAAAADDAEPDEEENPAEIKDLGRGEADGDEV